MSYQITCVCGNRFFITDQQLGHHVTCPSCNRALIPLTAQADPAVAADAATAVAPSSPATPPATVTAVSNAEPTKRCPFCGEMILEIAKKCKHCGEYLDRSMVPTSGTAGAGTPADAGEIPNDTPPVFDLAVSQWENFWKFIICGTVVILVSATLLMIRELRQYAPLGITGTVVIMAFIAWFFYIAAKNSRCIIRPNRIETETGIFAKENDTCDLIHIVDLDLHQGLVQRMLGIGTVVIKTTDATTPQLLLYQIPQARKVYKYLQDQVPIVQKQRGVIIVKQ